MEVWRKEETIGGEARINEVSANRREKSEILEGANRRGWSPEKVAELCVIISSLLNI